MCAADQPILFDDLGPRHVQADFSGGTLSTDAGALLLRQVDANLGLTTALAQCFQDERNPLWVDHSVAELLRQRLFGLALGYEDINDHQRLRLDPLLAAAIGLEPGEEVEWELLDRGELHLVRNKIPATRARERARHD